MYALQVLLTGIMIGSVYGLVALGFVLIYKCSRIFNIAQGEFLMLGGYFCYAFLVQLHLPAWVSVLLALIFIGLIGRLLAYFPIRPMLGQPIFAIIMVTIALAFCLKGIGVLFWADKGDVYLPTDFLPSAAVQLGDLVISQQHVFSFVIVIICVLFLSYFFRYTKIGLGMRVTAEDTEAAEAIGISAANVIGTVWLVSAIVAGIGGILLGSINGINVSLAHIGFKAFPAAIVAGLESLHGAVIGGIIIGVIEALAGAYIGHGISSVAAYLVLLAILFIKPYGLFGLKRIERI